MNSVRSAEAPEVPCSYYPELFFSEERSEVEVAKAMCVGCVERPDCLDGALERDEEFGVWGGVEAGSSEWDAYSRRRQLAPRAGRGVVSLGLPRAS